jgi:hypothetical protein
MTCKGSISRLVKEHGAEARLIMDLSNDLVSIDLLTM